MLDSPTYRHLQSPLRSTLCIGNPEIHWSCPRKYTVNDGKLLLKNLGAEKIDILDICGERTITQDLNLPWKTNKYWDTIIDVGTIEHVANPYTCLVEYCRHLHLNGRLVISTVYNNFGGHGYWQLTPQFLYDFLTTNGFHGVRIQLYSPFTFRVRNWNPSTKQAWTFDTPKLMVCSAIRGGLVTDFVPPQQRHWSVPYQKQSFSRQLLRKFVQALLGMK